MSKTTFKGQLLAVVFLLLCVISAHAADGSIITLDKAGTLPEKISDSEKYTITSLKIIGEMNGTDLRFLREMAGRNVEGERTDGKLATLDLSEAKIVSGGDSYLINVRDGEEYKTSNDVLGENAFCTCKTLTSVALPLSVTSIGASAFYGCI